jgi:ornithine carbamoyltransferase
MTATGMLAPRRVLGIGELSADAFAALLDLAAVMKRHPLAWRSTLEGRAVACLFDHPATRGRVSLEVAVHRLGALPVVLAAVGGSLADTARSLSTYCDAIAVHTDAHRDLLVLADHASVPVVNARTDRAHPCQALADCLVLRERHGALAGLEIAWVGASEPVTNSLLEAAIRAGFTVRIASPAPLGPDPALLARANGAAVICETPREAVAGAAAVYEATPRRELPDAYTVTPELVAFAAPDAAVLRATPTPEQAANLLPVEQALLRALVTGDWEA